MVGFSGGFLSRSARQSSRLTLEEAKAMDDPVASLRASLGYDGARDWLRWAQLAEDQAP